MDSMEQALTRNREHLEATTPRSVGESIEKLPHIQRVEHDTLAFGIDQKDPGRFRDFASMPPELAADIVTVGMRCTNFLRTPLIVDTFGTDHNEREKWQRSLDGSQQAYLEQNKLRKNILSMVIGGFAALGDKLRSQGDSARDDVQRLLEICARMPKAQ